MRNQFYWKADLSKVDTVVLIWYDQLNLIVWPEDVHKNKKPLLFIESKDRFDKIPYRKQKIAFYISIMQYFVQGGAAKGHKVYYILTKQSLDNELKNLLIPALISRCVS